MSDIGAKSDHLYEFVASEEDADFSTRIIHDGESPHASAFPIYQANTVEGIYVRMRNPTVEALEEKMRSLEGGATTVAMGSGITPITTPSAWAISTRGGSSRFLSRKMSTCWWWISQRGWSCTRRRGTGAGRSSMPSWGGVGRRRVRRPGPGSCTASTKKPAA